MDQQFEEMNNKLNSVTDPTGFLRMVRRNNLFNRCVPTQPPRPGCRITCFPNSRQMPDREVPPTSVSNLWAKHLRLREARESRDASLLGGRTYPDPSPPIYPEAQSPYYFTK